VLAAAQSLVLQDPGDFCRSQHLNKKDWKQATQEINKTVHQRRLYAKETILEHSTRRY
jgi:hypothetical protein